MPSNFGGMSKAEMAKRLQTQALTIAIQDETIRNLRACISEDVVRDILSKQAKKQHEVGKL
jgi:hypothetical protein